jgi:uncharacterized membrane protein YbhN (UPF0104 family)
MVIAVNKKHLLSALKIIGVILFGWIVVHIDRSQLREALTQVVPLQAILAVLSLFGIYIAKSMRWHTLVRSTGMHPTLMESWRLYCIGVFLGTITPGKIGELGRAAYLKKKGLPLKIGMLLSIADRAADAVIIVVLSTIGLAILGWPEWSLIIVATCIVAGAIGCLSLLRKIKMKLAVFAAKFFLKHVRPHLIAKITLYTCIGWVFYFMWAIGFARSLGIDTPIHILVATFTITGLFSMLPIAPNGLGTRDMALIILLAPYGVPTEIAVALALLMFASTVLGGLLGGIYWLRHT